MMLRWMAGAIAAAGLAISAPVVAGNDKIPGGDPCGTGPGQGSGNPCKGNRGNEGKNGNNGDDGTWNYHPDPFTVSRPGSDRGAFIRQIGDGGTATIGQRDVSQYASIGQDGGRNSATIAQSGTGAHYATAAQTGDDNILNLSQSGIAPEVALLQQTGNRNTLSIGQSGGVVSSGVAAQQLGNDNSMALSQAGSGNQALLIQNGSGNAMTASQTGGNNQLAWTQEGDNHTDLGINQTGGQALQVTQSW